MAHTASPHPSLQQARDLAMRAVDLLMTHQLAPTPLNYAVAYDYLRGVQAELTRFLDSHLGSGKPLDEVLLQDLYEKHIAAERHQVFHGMRNDLQNLLHALMETISDAASTTKAYQQGLESNIARLDRELDQSTLRDIAFELVTASMDASSQNLKLQQHLKSAQQEADQLRAELEAQRREAMIDPLTGLFNRRAMEQHLESIWAEDAGVSVLALDIDHFKRINDTYGHAVGDVVIRNVAETVRKCIRGEDIAIRFGGEEFLVLLPNTTLEGAVTVAETIRKRIEALRLVRKNDNFALAPFTISLGVAERRGDDDRDSLIERADKALYHSKSSGRNRVTHEHALH